MLSSMNCEIRNQITIDPRYERNEKEDLKLGIDYLWEFKEKLNKLHPQVTYTIEKLLQNNYR